MLASVGLFEWSAMAWSGRRSPNWKDGSGSILVALVSRLGGGRVASRAGGALVFLSLPAAARAARCTPHAASPRGRVAAWPKGRARAVSKARQAAPDLASHLAPAPGNSLRQPLRLTWPGHESAASSLAVAPLGSIGLAGEACARDETLRLFSLILFSLSLWIRIKFFS